MFRELTIHSDATVTKSYSIIFNFWKWRWIPYLVNFDKNLHKQYKILEQLISCGPCFHSSDNAWAWSDRKAAFAVELDRQGIHSQPKGSLSSFLEGNIKVPWWWTALWYQVFWQYRNFFSVWLQHHHTCGNRQLFHFQCYLFMLYRKDVC